MKRLFLSFGATGLLLIMAVSANAQLITGFGTSDFTATDVSSLIIATPSTSNYRIYGLDNGSYLTGTIPNFSINSSVAQLSLTATMATNPGSAFLITLKDSASNRLEFSGYWSQFTAIGTPQTITLNKAVSYNYGSFNGIASTLIIETGGTGSLFDISLDGLSAVPEPTSLLLLGMGLCGLAMRRSLRRR